jgi:hypothetical protein
MGKKEHAPYVGGKEDAKHILLSRPETKQKENSIYKEEMVVYK